MEEDRKDICGLCYFWIPDGKCASLTGVCSRYPQRIPKRYREFCGDFKPKIIKEVFREGSK